MKPRFLLALLFALASSAFAQTSSYYVPPGVTNIRAMLTGSAFNPGTPPQYMQDYCVAQRVGLAQLSGDLPAIAAVTGHPEIAHAAYVRSGISAGSEGAVAQAIADPANVIAIVGIHGAMMAIGNDGFNVNRGGDTPGGIFTIDAAVVAGIPQVHTFDNGDGFVSPVTLQGWVEYGRSLGAPWHFLIHNDGNHTDSNTALQTEMLPWLTAILDLRLPANAGTGDGTVTLIPIVESSGWLGDNKTKVIGSFASYAGDKAKASWFPNQSIATTWAGYHFAPPYTIPAQPILAPSGIIADLTILDPNNNDTTSGIGWRINSNFKEADQMNNDIKWWIFSAPPPSIAGLDWIRPIIGGRLYNNYTVDPIATFRVTAAADVFIAHADAIAPKPSWMSGFVDTGENLLVSAGALANGTSMSVFKKTFTANSTVTLGQNGGTGGPQFLVFVKAQGAVLPSISVTASTPNATEGGANGAFTVTRTGATTTAQTVNFSVSGTAASGTRYTSIGTSVVIPAGQSSGVLNVAVINDAVQQASQTVVLTLAANAAYNLGSPSSATVNILDDDSPPLPMVSVLVSNANASEPNVSGAFQFTRTGDTTAALTVNFSMSGTATAGTDYANPGTSISIPAGQTTATLTITPIDDALVEGTETCTLSISASATYALGATTIDTLNIADNDTSSLPVVTIVATTPNASEPNMNGVLTVTRAGATTSTLAVTFGFTGTATRAVDFTVSGASGTTLNIPAGQASANITVVVTNDALVEGTETAICTIGTSANYIVGSPSSGTVNIADDDGSSLPAVSIAATNANAAEPSTAGTFTVTRTGAMTAALAVNYAVTGTATSGTDYTGIGTSVSIPIGQASASITVTPIDDTLVEGTETVITTLSSNAAYTLGSPSGATVSITDNDTGGGGPTVTISSSDSTAAETSSGAANTGSITLTRDGATTSGLTVQLAYGGTATNGVDYNTMPGSVTLAVGSATATLTLTPIDDALVEGLETASVSIVASAAYTRGTTSGVGININDNDNATPISTIGIVFATHGTGTNTRDVKLNVYLPATGSGPWPVVIYYPGGGWSVQTESAITPLFTNWTESGYAVISANYITSSFEKWPAQIRDAKAAVRWVRANAATYGFDPTRIGVTGGSSGAHMAAYVALSSGVKTARVGSEVMDLVGTVGGNLEQSDAVQACAPMFPPTDLLVMDHYPTPGVMDHNAASSPESGLIGAAIQTVPEKTATANPMIHIRPGVPPMWVTQGTVDALVDFNQSELMNAALVAAGQPVTFWSVQGGGHGPGVSDSQEVIALMKTFFDRVLLGATANALPQPSFTANALTGSAPLTVNFDASASTDSDGVVTKYSWANGDDTGMGNGVTASYTYTHAGVYPVCLSVRDDKGGSASVVKNIVVTPATVNDPSAPTITLTSPAEGFLVARPGNFMTTVDAAAVSGTVASVEFWLNDKPYAWDSKPPYNYTLSLAPGRYRLVTRVSDTTGNSTTSSAANFRVLAPEDAEPVPSISGGLLTITYYRFTDGSVTYAAQRSTDLAGWTAFAPTQLTLQTYPTIEVRKATDPLSIGSDTRRFLRLEITSP